MKNLIYDYTKFINERYMAEETQSTQSNLPPNFITPNNSFDADGANKKLNMLTSSYGFTPEEAIQIGQNDTVRFYHGDLGKFNNTKQLIKSQILKDVQEFQIENSKQAIYYKVVQGSQDDPESAQSVDVIGILAATPPEPEQPTQNPIEAPETAQIETPGEPVQEELTAGQKKLPAGLQAHILKQQGESPKKEDDSEKDEEVDDSEKDESTDESDEDNKKDTDNNE